MTKAADLADLQNALLICAAVIVAVVGGYKMSLPRGIRNNPLNIRLLSRR